ncbi:hypothetical protein ACJJTC_007284 [Scirpophaga incertulas]
MVQVKICDGVLEGELVDNEFGGKFYSFKGIPYAEPPVGNLRFKAPKPVSHWNGVRKSLQFGSICYQRQLLIGLPPDGSEDCLYINVYSPDISPNANLPVMVWIHGGAFTNGSGNDTIYGPEFLIRHGVVVVTLNYRVGVLGFLCLETADAPGNAGMKDQVLALKWVQKNILQFGGDANNVTIFGGSAGGASVAFHLVSPMSKGLFARAICQSGCSLNFWTRIIDPRQKAIALAKKLGFYSEDDTELYTFFKNLPVEKMIDHNLQTVLGNKCYELDWAIVSEKQYDDNECFFYGDMTELLRSGIHDGVEIMTGYNEDEGILAFAKPNILEYSDNFLEFFVPKQIAMERPLLERLEIGAKFKNYYFKNGLKPSDNLDGLLKYISMDFLVFELISFTKFCSNANKIVYLYKFTCKSERNQAANRLKLADLFQGLGRTTVCHTDELPYLFNAKTINQKLDTSSETFQIISNVTNLWTNFAKYGNPTPDDALGVRWMPYSVERQHYLEIGNDLISRVSPDKDEVDFWDRVFKQTDPRYVI